MAITPKKNQYALRAIFELAKHLGQGPKKISEIAKAQAIPTRFLEVILAQLKSSGWVDSKRGFYGGYFLKRSPKEISVGDILRFMQGSSKPAECVACISKGDCPFDGKCAFAAMWNKVDRFAQRGKEDKIPIRFSIMSGKFDFNYIDEGSWR
ncbi:MAG: Rrf2 family transcriptional regulator [Desulfobacterales bacterium]|jgi:Rrf2 family protein